MARRPHRRVTATARVHSSIERASRPAPTPQGITTRIKPDVRRMARIRPARISLLRTPTLRRIRAPLVRQGIRVRRKLPTKMRHIRRPPPPAIACRTRLIRTPPDVPTAAGSLPAEQRTVQKHAARKAAADPPEPGKLQPALAHRTQRHERSRGDLEAHVSGAAAVCPAHPASEVAADVARPQAGRHRSSAYPAGHDSRRPPKIPERPAVHARPESRRAVRPPRPRSSPQSFQSVISHPRFSCFLQSASPKQEGILFFRPAMLTLTKHFLDLSQP